MLPIKSLEILLDLIQGIQTQTIPLFGLLDPLTTKLIGALAILGPLGIGGIVLLLKKIEKKNPSSIRWK